MATVVNSSQLIVSGGLLPASVYSRVVVCSEYVAMGFSPVVAVTESLASRLRLLGVDVWVEMEAVARFDEAHLSIRRGFHDPGIDGDINAWETVITPRSHMGILPIRLGLDNTHLHWDLCKLYEGGGQRFAIKTSVTGATQGWVYASFQISEY